MLGNYRTGLPFLINARDAYRQLNVSGYRLVQNLNNIGVSYLKLNKLKRHLTFF